jgi:uncharacterized protein (TIGR00255 family)
MKPARRPKTPKRCTPPACSPPLRRSTALKAARDAEGAAMVTVLTGHLGEIEALRAEAASNAEALPDAIKARIKAKFDELLPSGLDPERLEQEAAMLAVKADIREELDRLTAHIEAAHALLEGGSPAGASWIFWRKSLTAKPIRCVPSPPIRR